MLLDGIVAVVIALGFYLGYQRGFIKTVFDTLSLIIGVVAALKLSPILINIIEGSFNINPAISFIIGIVITFILVMILIRFVGKKLEDLLKAVHLNFLNKLNGGFLQAIFFTILLGLGIGLMDKVTLIKEETKGQSITYPLLTKVPALTNKAFHNLKPVFKEFWDKTVEVMEQVKIDK